MGCIRPEAVGDEIVMDVTRDTMSTEYLVTYSRAVDAIEEGIKSVLAHHGYVCEFAPHTDLLGTESEVLLVKVIHYATTKPRVRPDRHLIVAIELSNVACPDRPGLRTLTFRSTSGRSALSYAIQVLVAAALAEAIDGEFVDPQLGLILKAPNALKHALDEIAKRAPPHDLREAEFVGWT